jgi:hypothetical protein
VRAIAKAHGTTAAEINKIIDRFADGVITDKIGKHSLALELERLDQLQAVYFERALGGDVQSAALVERRGVMLGLHVPQTAVLKIVDEATPKVTATDRLEQALDRLLEDQNKPDPTAH